MILELVNGRHSDAISGRKRPPSRVYTILYNSLRINVLIGSQSIGTEAYLLSI